VLLAIAAWIPSAAQATPGWTVSALMDSVVVDGSYTTMIISGADNPAGCGVPSYIRIGVSDANYQSISSMILTAFAQHKPIKAWAYACLGDNSVHITGVWVDK
jgi:glucan biosynthesis protein